LILPKTRCNLPSQGDWESNEASDEGTGPPLLGLNSTGKQPTSSSLIICKLTPRPGCHLKEKEQRGNDQRRKNKEKLSYIEVISLKYAFLFICAKGNFRPL
jgi:hypothetical protein